MPYISRDLRVRLDPAIDELARRIAGETPAEDEASFAGPLNYACTRLALEIVRIRFGRIRYSLIALLTGVFRNVSEELYRRIGVPYEEGQRRKNGDLEEFKRFSSVQRAPAGKGRSGRK